MDEIGVLPNFHGTLVHDHWKPYYLYRRTHALCNAHHLRELTHAFEEDKQRWAKDMRDLLLAINEAVKSVDGALEIAEVKKWRKRYRQILRNADSEAPRQ